MKRRMEIKLKATFVFDTEEEELLEKLAVTPLAFSLAEGLKHHGLKVVGIEKADRTITDLDLTLPDYEKVRPLRPRKRKAG